MLTRSEHFEDRSVTVHRLPRLCCLRLRRSSFAAIWAMPIATIASATQPNVEAASAAACVRIADIVSLIEAAGDGVAPAVGWFAVLSVMCGVLSLMGFHWGIVHLVRALSRAR